MSSELKVPDIGDFKDVEIIEILVKEGQKVSKNDPLITLESDKSSVEVPSSLDGTIQKLNVKIGDKVSQGSIIGLIDNGSNEVDEKNNSEKKTNVSDSNSQNFITVPDIGDFKNVEIIEVLVKRVMKSIKVILSLLLKVTNLVWKSLVMFQEKLLVLKLKSEIKFLKEISLRNYQGPTK